MEIPATGKDKKTKKLLTLRVVKSFSKGSVLHPPKHHDFSRTQP